MKQNNPFNIRVNAANKWLGKIPTPNGFEAFDSLEHGIRAGLKLLQNYHKKGLNTVSKIINVFAPPVENETTNYIMTVCRNTGFNADQVLDLNDRATLLALAAEIIYVEQGSRIDPLGNTYNKYFT